MGRTSRGTNFSLPEGMEKEMDTRAKALGYANRSEYLRALKEADEYYSLVPTLEPVSMKRVLRIPAEVERNPGTGSKGKPGK